MYSLAAGIIAIGFVQTTAGSRGIAQVAFSIGSRSLSGRFRDERPYRISPPSFGPVDRWGVIPWVSMVYAMAYPRLGGSSCSFLA